MPCRCKLDSLGWKTALRANMSYLSVNNIINAALVAGAVLSGFGLTARPKETEEAAEVQDPASRVKVRTESENLRGLTPPGN